MGKVILTIVLGLIPYTVHASHCTRPDQPSCLSWLGSADRSMFDMCRAQMVYYQEEVRNFIDCSQRERKAAIDDLDEAIRKFNNCARDKYC